MSRPLTAACAWLIFGSGHALAQAAQQPPATLEFDAASVKRVTLPSDGRFAMGCRSEPGMYTCDYVTLFDLILDAYSVPAGRKLIGPEWMRTMPYRLYAKAAGPASRAELMIMLRNLLIGRFHLKLHTEDAPAPIYALVVNAKGFKLNSVTYEGDPNLGAFHPIVAGAEFKHTSMALFAGFLSGWANFGRPVIDATGIQGLYDFNLSYATKGFTPLLDPPPDADQPSIFEALQKIGLKLESRQGNLTTYLVDHIEQTPVEN